MKHIVTTTMVQKLSGLASFKALARLITLFLLTLLVSCNPSNTAVSDFYNINGTFSLKFTVTESSRDSIKLDSIIDTERTFETDGSTVSTVPEDSSNNDPNNIASGPRSGNTITLSRTTSTNIKIDTTITLLSDDRFTATTTSNYDDGSKVIYALVGTRKK